MIPSDKKINGDILRPDGKQDFLFRISLKAVIFNDAGEILVVKENDRDWWDIPGGGMDHGESIKEALARELYEEVLLVGDFGYEAILAEDPHYLSDNELYQMRLIFLVKPSSFDFGPGIDAAEVKFMDLETLKNSDDWKERKNYEYAVLAKERLKL